MAKVQLDNLKGSVELLSGAFDSLQIRLGASFAPIMRTVVDAITPIINAIGDFAQNNPKLSATILIVLTALTGLVTVLAALGLALPMITA